MKHLLHLIGVVFALVRWCTCGTISPTSNPAPIYNSLANAGVRADYVFSFIPQNFLPAGGFLKITFPSQYSSTTAFPTGASLVCSQTCTTSGLTITFKFSYDLAAGIRTPSILHSTFFINHHSFKQSHPYNIPSYLCTSLLWLTTAQTVSVNQVMNPATKGGVGSFILKTL